MTKQLLMGNEAMAYAALEAGVRVAAGYPGTPSSEIIETIARLHAKGAAHGVHVEWSTNEKAALELLGGAAMAGARCLFTCKQMGLNVASDPLMCLNYVGVRGGLVLIVADDPGPISSQTEQDTRRFAAFAKVPVLDPATPEQAYDMVKAAFGLSERIGAPVIVRPTTRVDHASAFFEVPEATYAREVPDDGFVRDPDRWVIFPRRSYAAHGAINARLPQMAHMFSDEEPWALFNPIEEAAASAGWRFPQKEDAPVYAETQKEDAPVYAETGEDVSRGRHAACVPAGQEGEGESVPAPKIGFLAGGVSAAYAREALRIVRERAEASGIALPPYRFMQVGTAYPFPDEAVARFAEGLDDILVFEELDCVLEDGLLWFAGCSHAPFIVHGKQTGEARDRGENDVDDIAARIAAFLDSHGAHALGTRGDADESAAALAAATADAAADADADSPVPAVGESAADDGLLAYEGDLPVRPPVLCPGCPHRGSFYAVKCALGKTPAVLCGDIGCYTLGNAKPLEAVDTCLCMGAGITMAQGIAVADPGKKAVAFVGDSTFFASGMPGLANAAYNGHDITVAVLDNATTAMTGSQPHPGTGVTLMGPRRTPLSIEAVLNANGFARVYRADPLDKDAAIVAAKAAIAFEGPSAVIFSSPCVQLIEPGEPPVVDAVSCIGCKKCIGEIGCPAISFDAELAGPKSGTRGQAVIDPGMCNGCGLCAQVCPARAIVAGKDAHSVAGVMAAGAIEAAAMAESARAGIPADPPVLEECVKRSEQLTHSEEEAPDNEFPDETGDPSGAGETAAIEEDAPELSHEEKTPDETGETTAEDAGGPECVKCPEQLTHSEEESSDSESPDEAGYPDGAVKTAAIEGDAPGLPAEEESPDGAGETAAENADKAECVKCPEQLTHSEPAEKESWFDRFRNPGNEPQRYFPDGIASESLQTLGSAIKQRFRGGSAAGDQPDPDDPARFEAELMEDVDTSSFGEPGGSTDWYAWKRGGFDD